MRPSRAVLVVWTLVVVVLVVLEIAEITRLFTIPIVKAFNDPIFLVISLVFTTLIAVVGAIFVGISITTRLLSPRGFTPFEEEMLRMRADLAEVRKTLEELRARGEGAPPATTPSPPAPGGRP